MELARALLGRPDLRLLTIIGPGGIGKTRLALEIARELADAFADGVRFVPLADVADPALVPTTVARAAGILETGDRAVADTLAIAFSDADSLLVLDNFEHVLAATRFLTALLANCPRLTILVTSRTLLRTSGEQALPVLPLSLPDPGAEAAIEAVARAPAVQLFTQRAQALNPSFTLTAVNASLVTDICRRLDGVPLAIELAAARVNHLPLPILRDRLDQRLSLLTSGDRDRPDRHRTMRGAIAWSHDLLSGEQQALFRRLAVFAGGCTLEAAEDVGGQGGREAGGQDGELLHACPPAPLSPSVLDGIAALVDGSLLEQETLPTGTDHYRMLETVRQYAAELLAASGEEEAIRAAHARFYLTFVEQRPPGPFLPDDQVHLGRLDAEHANLRAALAWLAATGEEAAFARLAGALAWFWFVRGHHHDGAAWLERARRCRERVPPPVRTTTAVGFGMIALAQADYARAGEALTDGLTIAQAAGDALGAAQALIALGILACAQEDYERATSVLAEALALAGTVADPRLAASLESAALANLGVAVHAQGQLAAAAGHHEEALARQRTVGYVRGEMLSLLDLGDVARDRGETARAAAYYRDGLALAWAYGEQRAIAEALEGMACAVGGSGHAATAVRWFAASERLRQTTGIANWLAFNRAVYQRAIAAARTALGEQAFATVWAVGREASPAQAVAEALDPVTVAGGSSRAGLTPRELDILRLLVTGLPDRAIAEALFLSVRTVENHLARIFAKLGVHTRTAAATAAITAGLVDPDPPASV
jgi:non-specific serine/threonine protein kinase